MLNKFAISLANLLLKNNVIQKKELNIYIYGWILILSTAISIFTILILSIIFQQLLGSMLFLLFFFTLRAFAGGYHSNTHYGCFIFTQGIYLFAVFLYYNIPTAFIKIFILCSIIISYIFIFTKAPVDHPNKPLSSQNKKKFFYISTLIIFMQTIYIITSLYWLKTESYSLWAALGMIAACFTLLKENS